MECNKGEADRAREIAVKKFTEKDIVGAKKFALKAQNMYPELDGLPQMLATLEVYVSAEKRINGVIDWYGVLGVDPLADDDTIRKKYRRLALTLHPDKNNSVGADGAFKILSEAWSLLSDTSKKIAYDQKRNLRIINQKVPTPNLSVPAGKNGFHNFTKCKNASSRTPQNNTRKKTYVANPNSMDQRKATRPNSTPQCIPKSDRFSTVCSHCKMQHEYNKIYLSQTLLCPNCLEAFYAVDMSAPPNAPTPCGSNLQGQNTTNSNSNPPPNKHAASPDVGKARASDTDSLRANFRSGVYSKPVVVQGIPAPGSSAAQAAQPTREFQLPKEILNKGREALRKKFNASKKAGAGLASGSSPAFSGSVCRGERPIKKRRVDGKSNCSGKQRN